MTGNLDVFDFFQEIHRYKLGTFGFILVEDGIIFIADTDVLTEVAKHWPSFAVSGSASRWRYILDAYPMLNSPCNACNGPWQPG